MPKQVRAIRARVELAGNLRDVALLNVAIDSELRGGDMVELRLTDLIKAERVRECVSVIQSKISRPVQFEPTESPVNPLAEWVVSPEGIGCSFMFPSRFMIARTSRPVSMASWCTIG